MKRILVVDDNPAVRDLLVDFLTSRGYEVESCQDGDAALLWLSENRPDALLLDLCLPGTSGADVLAKARDLYSDLPVMIISGGGDETLARQELGKETYDFLPKPFDLPTLAKRLAARLQVAEQPAKAAR